MTYWRIILVFLLADLLFSCGNDAAALPETVNFPEAEMAEIPNLFELQKPEATGVTFINKVENTPELNYLDFAYIFNGGGVAVLDYDKDGLQDLYFVSNQQDNKLYHNEGDWKFTDVTQQAGVAAPGGQSSGVAIVDINADGLPDIYLTRTGYSKVVDPKINRNNLLFVNQGDGRFAEEAASRGLNSNRATTQANFFDYDGDGDLDCYLLNIPFDFGAVNKIRAQQTPQGIRRILEPTSVEESDQLLRNDGGKFTDVSAEAGINNFAFALSSIVHDFNGDGRPDIYVANDYVGADNLYINSDNGTFTDQLSNYFRHTSLNSMGSDLGDVNNDGLPDMVVVDMLAGDPVRQKSFENGMRPDRYNTLARIGYGHQIMRNVMQLNNGNGFSEIGELTGIAATDWSWAPLMADFDNDRRQDLFISNGFRYDVTDIDFISFVSDSAVLASNLADPETADYAKFLSAMPTEPQGNFLYRNLGGLNFKDVSDAWAVSQPTYSSSAAYADLDNDGDLDLIVGNHEEPPHLYRNQAVESGQGGNWLQIKAEGSVSNPAGYGLTATAYVGSEVLYQQLTPIRGFLGTSEALLHFGLGNTSTVDRLEIRWPDGKTQTLQNVPANQRLNLKYGDAGNGKLAGADAGASYFTFQASQQGLRFAHQENDFDDFDRQFLQPRMLSREGPALAAGDMNGDGLADVFFGGAANQPSELFLQQSNGTFQKSPAQLPATDAVYEDVDAVIFDADGDGVNDLYVVSGGNSNANGSALYQDRLYLNQQGSFVAGFLPAMPTSTGIVAVIDYDQDGDSDLLVGGRTVPGSYPRAPRSYLLQNSGGKFTDVTQEVIPEFANIGMVTAIAIGNVEGNDQPEIVVAGEWMPVTIFAGSKAGFAPSANIITNSSGLWRSLLLVDLDGDNLNEIVAGNEGLNSHFKPTAERPMTMYAADFDGNGMMDPIITITTPDGKQIPLTTRAQMLKQLPGLKKKFVRTRDYAKATINDTFSAEQLEKAAAFQVTTLATTVYHNKGGGWLAERLPQTAQIAPCRAIRSADFNKDGKPDLFLLGNDYGEQVETGRMDAGNGTLLLNDGKGGWITPPNREHGFWASLDARRLVPVPLATGPTAWVVANNNGPTGLFLQK